LEEENVFLMFSRSTATYKLPVVELFPMRYASATSGVCLAYMSYCLRRFVGENTNKGEKMYFIALVGVISNEICISNKWRLFSIYELLLAQVCWWKHQQRRKNVFYSPRWSYLQRDMRQQLVRFVY